METVNWAAIVESLKVEVNIDLDAGISDDEVHAAETEYGFRFPSDLRAFLQTALPVGDNFPDWRSDDNAYVGNRLGWPLEGMCFDIEHNDFWLDEWEPRPDSLEQAFAVARKHVSEAPTLIPIYSHRYIPEVPQQSGNPVFSVYQTDITFYGFDLLDYFAHEFKTDNPTPRPSEPRRIEFWDLLV